MNCAYLCSAIEEAVSAYGYTPYQGDKSYAPTLITRYPAAHLLPPEFHSIEGRNHGKIRYSIELHLLHQASRLSPAERNDLLDEMESDLIEIFTLLSEYDSIAGVEELTLSPVATIDNHGAMAMVAQAEIVTLF